MGNRRVDSPEKEDGYLGGCLGLGAERILAEFCGGRARGQNSWKGKAGGDCAARSQKTTDLGPAASASRSDSGADASGILLAQRVQQLERSDRADPCSVDARALRRRPRSGVGAHDHTSIRRCATAPSGLPVPGQDRGATPPAQMFPRLERFLLAGPQCHHRPDGLYPPELYVAAMAAVEAPPGGVGWLHYRIDAAALEPPQTVCGHLPGPRVCADAVGSLHARGAGAGTGGSGQGSGRAPAEIYSSWSPRPSALRPGPLATRCAAEDRTAQRKRLGPSPSV